MTPRSGSSSTLASRSSDPKAAVKAPRFSFQARSRSSACSGSAIAFQCRARSSRPSRDAIAARRWQPAQHIAVECVWMRWRPRYSQMPASGCSAHLAAWLPSCSSRRNSAFVAGSRQAAIEEHRHGGEDDAAIGVVLDLRRRRIADPHRSVAAVALQVGGDAFLQRDGRHDAVDRTQRLVGIRRDAEREGDEVLHGLGGADPVERLHHEIGIAQPAVAIVPGPAGTRRLPGSRSCAPR